MCLAARRDLHWLSESQAGFWISGGAILAPMQQQLVTLDLALWADGIPNPSWIQALEAGNVLYFPKLAFELQANEQRFLNPALLSPKSRNISLDVLSSGALQIKGVQGDTQTQQSLAAMVLRFHTHAQSLVNSLFPQYTPALRIASTSFRPAQVETRVQSWRADDKRLHIDAFVSRPNRGERILRVFTNVNPHGIPRVWRVGEPFEDVARHFLPRAKPYSARHAVLLKNLHVTKSLRSEYDHLMLQLHDGMKSDLDYQRNAVQQTVPFAAGSVWVCFSDQTSHAVMSGQYMIEQTMHLPAARQYDPSTSPLAVLERLTGRTLT